MQRGKRTHIYALIIVVHVIALVGVLILLNGREMLTGETEFDFGIMPIERGEDAVRQTHTYVLTNTSSQALEVEYAKSSCGCVSVSTDRTVIPVGEQLRIDAVMTLRRPGFKKVAVRLGFIGQGEQSLVLTGTARRDQRVFSIRANIPIDVGGETSVSFVHEVYEHDDTPQPPLLDVTDGFTARFADWSQTDARDASFDIPARWRGRIDLSHTTDVLADDAAITITMLLEDGSSQSVTIPIVEEGRDRAPDAPRSSDIDPLGQDGSR